MFYCSCFQCPLWKPAYSCNGGYNNEHPGCQRCWAGWLAEKRERQGRPQSDKLCHPGPGSQCLWPQSHSLTCIQSLPHQPTQITCSRTIQHQMLPLLKAHISSFPNTLAQTSFLFHPNVAQHIGLPMNNQLIYSRVS